MRSFRWIVAIVLAVVVGQDSNPANSGQDRNPGPRATADTSPGFTPLFNGKDFSGWKVPAGDNGHWKILPGGVIDYDAKSEAKKDKNLWTEKSYRDFVLLIDWKLKTDKG